MKLRQIFVIFLIFIFFLVNYVSAGEEEMKFKTIQLTNGAKIKHLYRKNIPIVYMTVLIPASPLQEVKTSQAYLTAHLLTHGTKNRSARQIEDELDFYAISIDKKVTYDYTILTVATTKKYLKNALELFFDVLKNPDFPEEEFKKEVSILEKSLLQMEKEPSFIANKRFLSELFDNHPYGRPVEGLPENLKNLKREDILEFYNNFYKPDRMIFSFVGDINEKELSEIKSNFIGKWNGKSFDIKINPITSAKRQSPKETFIKRDDLTQSTIVLGFEGISREDPDFYAFSLMNYILGGGGLTSRLAKNIREEQGLAYSIYSTFSPYLLPGAFSIEVKTKRENTDRVVKMIVKELEELKHKGVSDEELRDAKAFLIGSFPMRIDSLRKISEFLVVTDFYRLGDDYIKKYHEYIEKVTKEEIQTVATKFIQDKSYILVIVGNK